MITLEALIAVIIIIVLFTFAVGVPIAINSYLAWKNRRNS